MAESVGGCPYMVKLCGIPVCGLNVMPCASVSQKMCEMAKLNKSKKTKVKTRHKAEKSTPLIIVDEFVEKSE